MKETRCFYDGKIRMQNDFLFFSFEANISINHDDASIPTKLSVSHEK